MLIPSNSDVFPRLHCSATSVSAQADLRGDAAGLREALCPSGTDELRIAARDRTSRPRQLRPWLNGNEADGAGYREVRRGELARVVERDVPWSRTRIGVPEAVQLSGLN